MSNGTGDQDSVLSPSEASRAVRPSRELLARYRVPSLATLVVLFAGLALAGFVVFVAGVEPVAAQEQRGPVNGTAGLDVTVPDTEFERGEEDSLDIFIDNDGVVLTEGNHPEEVRDLVREAGSANANLTESPDEIDVRTGEQSVGTIEHDETAAVSFDIFVDEDADPGEYDLELTLDYQNRSVANYTVNDDGELVGLEEGESRNETETFDITVEVEDEAQFDIVDVDHNVQVDETGDYTLEINNTGTLNVSDMVVTAQATDQDIFFGTGGATSERSVGEWNAGETKQLTFRAGTTDAAITEPYPIDITFEYEDPDGEELTQAEQTQLEPQPRQTYTVEKVDHNISIGDDGVMELELTNHGPKDVENATIGLNTGDPAITFQDADGGSTTTQTFVGDWEAGETRELALRTQVGADAVERNYTIEAAISARDTQDEELDTRTREFGFEPHPKQVYTVENVSHDIVIGDDGLLELDVRNHGPQDVTNATVTLNTGDPALTFEDVEGGSTTTQTFVDGWEANETKTLTMRVGASDDAAERNYSVDLAVDALDEDDSELSTRTREFGIEPLPRQTYTVEGVSHDVPIADDGVMELEVKNHGPRNVTDASVEVSTNDQAIVFGSGAAGEPVQFDEFAFETGETGSPASEAFVDNWTAGETKTLRYQTGATDDALERNYTIDVTVDARDKYDYEMSTRTREFGFQPHAEQTFAIEETETALRVGEDGDVAGTVTNEGDQTVENVVVLYDSDLPNVFPRDTQYAVGTLEPGETAEFEFRLGLSEEAEPGPRLLEFETRYRNHADEVRLDDSRDVLVDVQPQRDAFSFDPIDATFEAGESGTVEMEMTNTKDERLESIRVKMFTDSPLSSDDDEAFVGALDADESTTVVFDLDVDSGATPKTYPVSIDVRYDDERGDTQLSGTIRVPIEVVEADDPLVPLWLVGALLVLLAVVAYVLRDRLLTVAESAIGRVRGSSNRLRGS